MLLTRCCTTHTAADGWLIDFDLAAAVIQRPDAARQKS